MIIVTTDIIVRNNNLGDTYYVDQKNEAIDIILNALNIENCSINRFDKNILIQESSTKWGMICLETDEDCTATINIFQNFSY